jgi:hypothetical protein
VADAPTKDTLPLTEERATSTRGKVAPDDRAQEEAFIQGQLKRAGEESDALSRFEQSSVSAEDREQAPVEKAIDALMQDESNLRAPPSQAAKMKFTSPPDGYNSQGVQSLGFALVAAAVIGGIASRGNWQAATAPLIGALQGWHDGDIERHQRGVEDFERQFKIAMEHDQQAMKEYEDLLRSKNTSINMMIRRSQEIAARHGHDAIRANAMQRSIDGIMTTVGAHQQLLTRLDVEKQSFMQQYGSASRSAAGQMAAGPGWNLLDEDGKWLVGATQFNGWDRFSNLVSGHWGANNAPMVNDMAHRLKAAGVSPEDISANHFGQAVFQSLQRNVGARRIAVERLTNTIKTLEPRVAALTNKVNGFGPRWENATSNALTTWLTAKGRTADVTELNSVVNAVSLMVQEARVMPGSNAQMHATTQLHAAEIMGPTMSIEAMRGAIAAANAIINAETQALKDMQQQLRGEQVSMGSGIWPTPGEPSAAAPAPVPAAPAASSSASAAPGYEGQSAAEDFMNQK